MKAWIGGVLALFCANLANAETLADVQSRFAAQTVVRAHFEQTRQISGLPQPLRSAGEMIFTRDDGLLWRQTKPFPMRLLLDDSRMVQDIDGQPPQIVTAKDNPQLFQFNRLLRTLFLAERAVLEQNFDLSFKDRGEKGWGLRLVPMTSPLDKLFSGIDLDGRTYLERVVLHDRQGDLTEIVFSDHRLVPAALSDDERRLFASP